MRHTCCLPCPRSTTLSIACPSAFRQLPRVTVAHAQYVPSDSFGGMSPERAGSRALRNLFTFIGARIVLSQLEGSGRGSLAAYDKQSYDDLSAFLQDERMIDCDEWLAKLMRKNSSLALRIMEVRLAYSSEDFEWDNLQKLTLAGMAEGNVRIMRQSASASLNAQFTGEASLDALDGSSSQSDIDTSMPPAGNDSPPKAA